MRRPLPESYTLLPVIGGVVICFQRGRRCEYLGPDGLWHRNPKNCDAFTSNEDAQRRIERLEDHG